MKALAYLIAHPLSEFAVLEAEVPEPSVGPNDLLVEVKAISVNPVDTKVRKSRSAEGARAVILGWDASGVVLDCGSSVKGFKKGDEVFYAGELNRPGCNAPRQAVDHRLVSHKPKNLTFAEAAAFPLTSLTAYEMLFQQFRVPLEAPFDLLVIGGAGGVGSMTVQLVKAMTNGRVFATAGREASKQWLMELGADGIFDRTQPLALEMKKSGLSRFDCVFSTTGTGSYWAQLPDIVKPFGDVGLIDDPGEVDIVPFKRKAVRISWEFMFARSLFNEKPELQGKILSHVAELAEKKKLRSTMNALLKGLTSENLREAHRRMEEGTAVGKTVIEL